jgi:hypothetical protein
VIEAPRYPWAPLEYPEHLQGTRSTAISSAACGLVAYSSGAPRVKDALRAHLQGSWSLLKCSDTLGRIISSGNITLMEQMSMIRQPTAEGPETDE